MAILLRRSEQGRVPRRPGPREDLGLHRSGLDQNHLNSVLRDIRPSDRAVLRAHRSVEIRARIPQ